MKKVKVNAAKLQLNKQMVTSLAAISGGGPRPPVTRGLGGCPSDSICNDACPSFKCTIAFCEPPTKTIGGLSIDQACVGSVDLCAVTLDPPTVTTC